MAVTKIKISMDEAKSSPLKYFMEKQDMTIEIELEKRLNELYMEHVPPEMREYIEHEIGENEPVQEQAEQPARAQRGRQTVANSNRRSVRNVHQGSAQEEVSPIVENEVVNEEPSMVLGQ